MSNTQTKHPLRQFLVSNHAQRTLKIDTNEDYDAFADAEIQEFLEERLRDAERLDVRQLADLLDPSKGLTSVISQLPWDTFDWQAYEPSDLVTTLWVSDLPHEVTHGTLEDVLQFARSAANQAKAPVFFGKVERLLRLPAVLSLPILVVEPSRFQRTDRRHHGVNSENPGSPPWCTVARLEEGRAYIEDGNHRAVAKLLHGGEERLQVIRFRVL